MRTIVTTVLIFLLALMAPEIYARGIDGIALKAGISFAYQTRFNEFLIKNRSYSNYDPELGSSSKGAFGPAFIINTDLFNGKVFGLSADFGYVAKGFATHEFQYEDQGTIVKEPGFNYRFNYLVFSPLIKMRKEFKKVIPYIFAGPRIDFYFSQYHNSVREIEKYEDLKNTYGLNYGLGLEIKRRKLGYGIEFQHHYDFSYAQKTFRSFWGEQRILNTAFLMTFIVKYYFKK